MQGGQNRNRSYCQNDLENVKADFIQRYPSFASTHVLDELRTSDYGRLDAQHQIYLDYTGGGLYASSQLRQHMELLGQHVFGNPHSSNPTSMAMTHLIDRGRAYVLEYFNASTDEYEVVFTLNASGALKLVGEAYPFGPGDHYILTSDNHNSVNGIREFASRKGASVTYIPVVAPDLRLDEAALNDALGQGAGTANRLFAYPAQSNFSGVQHSLEWIEIAQSKGWDVLLDVAAFVPTNGLDLGVVHPDFVVLSFYKIFGYPTGVGALLVRKDALEKLRRPWFAGGTIAIASVKGNNFFFVDGGVAFEDGTVNYLNLAAIEIGLRHIAGIGIETIHERVMCLTGWLLENLLALRHSNGRPMVRVLGPGTTAQRGGTIAFNFYDPDGQMLADRRIEELANAANISLRTGCFCNPGAGEIAHSLTSQEMCAVFARGKPMSFSELSLFMQERGKSISAIRISVGLATTFEDAYCFMSFAERLRDETMTSLGPLETPDQHRAQPDTA